MHVCPKEMSISNLKLGGINTKNGIPQVLFQYPKHPCIDHNEVILSLHDVHLPK